MINQSNILVQDLSKSKNDCDSQQTNGLKNINPGKNSDNKFTSEESKIAQKQIDKIDDANQTNAIP